MKLKRICSLCGNEYAIDRRVIKLFCGNCLKEIRGQMYLASVLKRRRDGNLRMV